MTDSFKSRTTLKVGTQQYEICSLSALKAHKVDRLPFSLKILLENLLRFEDGVNVSRSDIEAKLQADKSQQLKNNAAGWTSNDRMPPNPGHGLLASLSSNVFLTAL